MRLICATVDRGTVGPAEPAEPTEPKKITVFITTTFGYRDKIISYNSFSL